MDSKLGATLWDISLEAVAAAADATHITIAKDEGASMSEGEILGLLAPVPTVVVDSSKSFVGRSASSSKED